MLVSGARRLASAMGGVVQRTAGVNFHRGLGDLLWNSQLGTRLESGPMSDLVTGEYGSQF